MIFFVNKMWATFSENPITLTQQLIRFFKAFMFALLVLNYVLSGLEKLGTRSCCTYHAPKVASKRT